MRWARNDSILLPGLGQFLDGNSPGLESLLVDSIRLEGLPAAPVRGCRGPVGAVEIPIRHLNVDEQNIDISLELGTLLIKANARDQDAFHPPADVERSQDAARMRGPDLVNFNAEALHKRLLKLKLQARAVARV